MSRGAVVFVAQIIGGIAAAGAVSATLPGPMAVNVRLGGDCTIVRGLFIEMFATLQLVFAVVMLAAVKHKATYLAPIGIGIALFIGHLCSECSFLGVQVYTATRDSCGIWDLIRADIHQASTTPEQESIPLERSARTSSLIISRVTTGYTGLDRCWAPWWPQGTFTFWKRSTGGRPIQDRITTTLRPR